MSESDDERQSEEGPHPRKRSLVWRFFEKISRFRVRCHLCQHEQNYQGATGNILRHLKAKHDLDMTLKGQRDPQNQKRIKELCEAAASVSGKHNHLQNTSYNFPNFSTNNEKPLDEDSEPDPYEQDSDTPHNMDNFVQLEDPFYMDNENSKSSTGGEKLRNSKRKDKTDLEQKRVKAETQYFHEKAGYYKLLRYLTALQAKKVKIEIEKLTANDST